MKKFLIRILLFSLPFLVWAVVLTVIDPYGFWGKERTAADQWEEKVAGKLNDPLLKLNQFKASPTSGILLGDSRVYDLQVSDVEAASDRTKFSNLSYGGGSVKEVVLSFWYAAEMTDLKEVYIGINFFNYSEMLQRDRVSEAMGIMDSVPSYLSSRHVTKSVVLILRQRYLNQQVSVGKPDVDRDAFWTSQLKYADTALAGYSHPGERLRELREISEYCNTHGIKLVFFSSPCHHDLITKVKQHNLEAQREQFRKEMNSLGIFFEFNYLNSFTENAENFHDPFHYKPKFAKQLINSLFGGSEPQAGFVPLELPPPSP